MEKNRGVVQCQSKSKPIQVRGVNLTEVEVVVDRVSAGHHESDHVEHGCCAAGLDVGLPVLVLCLLNREGHAGRGNKSAPEPLLPVLCCCCCCSLRRGPIHGQSRSSFVRPKP